MKEIGEFLKSSRINNGVSIEEAAEDLNLAVTQLENMEDGNIRAFKDVYALRELVKEYGKYLGVATDSIMEEFNDFMFEHTSKISLDDILEARKISQEKDMEEKSKVLSPYTRIRKKKMKMNQKFLRPLLILIGILLVIFITVFIWFQVENKEEITSSELMGKNMEELYEFTY